MRFQPLLGWINGCCDVGRGGTASEDKGDFGLQTAVVGGGVQAPPSAPAYPLCAGVEAMRGDGTGGGEEMALVACGSAKHRAKAQ